MEITSAQNPRIKQLLLLQQKSAERRRSGLFVVEGQRELEHCLAAGYVVEQLFVCESLKGSQEAACSVSASKVSELLPSLLEGSSVSSSRAQGRGGERLASENTFTIPPALYERIAYRGSTEGVIAVVRARRQSLSDLQLSANPLIVVLERVEKPGNLGAILRSADAAGADAVVVCDPLTDLYNPNLIRSSIGAIFTVPCVACTSAECIAFLKARGIQILTAQLQDSRPYYDTDMRRPTAIVMGTEATGLTDQWRESADAHILIPMLGRLDSLNVSVSSAILLYEAVRQRNGSGRADE